jgi:hypothetical protein
VYSFPFELPLPDSLQASFVYCGLKRSKLSIIYFLKASLTDSMSLFVPLTSLTSLELIQASLFKNEVAKLSSVAKTITHYGIIKRGPCSLTVTLDKPAYCPKDAIKVSCQVKNALCTSQINRVCARLRRDIIGLKYKGQVKGSTYSDQVNIISQVSDEVIPAGIDKEVNFSLELSMINFDET